MQVQEGTGSWGDNGGAVLVVGRPLGDVGEEGPDLGRGDVFDDAFV